MAISKGEEASITLLLHLVSHVPELTEIQVNLDPTSVHGLTIEQVYVTENAKGEITGRDIV